MKVDGDDVYLEIAPIEELDAVFATEKTCNGASCHEEHSHSEVKKTLPTRKAKVNDPFAVSPLGEPV